MAYSEVKIQQALKEQQVGIVGEWLMARAFFTTGFTLWTR